MAKQAVARKIFITNEEILELQKGDTIDGEELEQYLCVSRKDNPQIFQLVLWKLKDRIERVKRRYGSPVTATCENGRINILTDIEASEYNTNYFQIHEKSLWRCHQKTVAVDAGRLDSSQRETHDRALVVQGMKLSALKRVEKKIQLMPTQRNIPGLSGKQVHNPSAYKTANADINIGDEDEDTDYETELEIETETTNRRN